MPEIEELRAIREAFEADGNHAGYEQFLQTVSVLVAQQVPGVCAQQVYEEFTVPARRSLGPTKVFAALRDVLSDVASVAPFRVVRPVILRAGLSDTPDIDKFVERNFSVV